MTSTQMPLGKKRSLGICEEKEGVIGYQERRKKKESLSTLKSTRVKKGVIEYEIGSKVKKEVMHVRNKSIDWHTLVQPPLDMILILSADGVRTPPL